MKIYEGKTASEITDAIDNRGSAVKKREDTHKMVGQIKHLHIIGGNSWLEQQT